MILSVEEPPKSKYTSPPKRSIDAGLIRARRYVSSAVLVASSGRPSYQLLGPNCVAQNFLDMADILPGASKRQRTPLPADQIAILLFLRFCESASMFVIFPFLNEVRTAEQLRMHPESHIALQLMASVTGGDSSRVGYYAGIMVRPASDALFDVDADADSHLRNLFASYCRSSVLCIGAERRTE